MRYPYSCLIHYLFSIHLRRGELQSTENPSVKKSVIYLLHHASLVRRHKIVYVRCDILELYYYLRSRNPSTKWSI